MTIYLVYIKKVLNSHLRKNRYSLKSSIKALRFIMTKGAKFPPRRILYLLRIQSGVQASFEESTSPRKFLYALKSFTKGFKFV